MQEYLKNGVCPVCYLPWMDAESLTRAEVETRLKLWDQIHQLKKSPGNESVHLSQVATGIGVRETRRILGEYVVTEQDAMLTLA